MKDRVMGVLRTELPSRDGMKQPNTDAHIKLDRRGASAGRIVLHEDAFVSMLYLERRRAERAHNRFVLMLVDVKDAITDGQKNRTLSKVTNALLSVTRETDIVGWYLEDHLIGVIGTEVGQAKPKTVQSRMLEKVRAAFVEARPQCCSCRRFLPRWLWRSNCRQAGRYYLSRSVWASTERSSRYLSSGPCARIVTPKFMKNT